MHSKHHDDLCVLCDQPVGRDVCTEADVGLARRKNAKIAETMRSGAVEQAGDDRRGLGRIMPRRIDPQIELKQQRQVG